MIFAIPHEHTYWRQSIGRLQPSQELVDWLIVHKIDPVFTLLTDNDRGFMRTKYLTINIEDDNKAVLFKLTWL